MVQRIKAGAPPTVRRARGADPSAPKKPATSEEPPKATGWAAKPNARSASLQRALADQKVTDAEWKALGPELQKSQLGAPENRQLLEAFASPNVRFDARAAEQAQQVLVAKGYDVSRPGLSAAELKHLTEGNVAEADLTFEALSQAVGADQATGEVAIVDGGFHAHPMLADNLAGDGKAAKAAQGTAIGQRFGKFTALEQEAGAHHGTHVAGIATKGTSQIQASLFAIPLEVPDDPQAAQKLAGPSPLPDALEAAAKSGAPVVNVSIESFVTPEEAQRYRQVMEQHPDTLFVFGAGNDQYELGSATEGDKSVVESFRLPNMVVVGASNPDGGRWGKSNTSEKFVDLAARGHAINSASSKGPGLIMESGTSMAAPNVSNLAAKCRLLHPALTPAKVVKLMAATSDAHHSWKGQAASGGTINADRAMQAAATLALVDKGTALPRAMEELGIPLLERSKVAEALSRL